MTSERQRSWRRTWPVATHFLLVGGILFAAQLSPAAAQDIRGLEVCTAEKQMERRTGCLQSNIDFLQQSLAKLARETQEKISAANRDLAAARAEIVTLKSAVTKLTDELAQLKAKPDPNTKK
jgi:septal ring factor EnvC (AmiA/AmiB activator)